MQKLASMINSYSPRKIRQSCIGNEKMLLRFFCQHHALNAFHLFINRGIDSFSKNAFDL